MPPRPVPGRLPADPLSDASLACLRLLAGFLLYGRGVGTRWLAEALPAGEPACRALARLAALARRSPAVRRELDRGLDRELADAAAPLEALSLFELAGLWARERGRLRGRPLAALLWTVARRNDLPGRRLADRIARGLALRDLVGEDAGLPPEPPRAGTSESPRV